MPPYAFLEGRPLNLSTIQNQMKTLRLEGVPYTDSMIERAVDDAYAQAGEDYDVEALRRDYNKAAGREGGVNVREFDAERGDPSEMDALIAYLQVLGTMVDFSTYQAEDLSNQR